VLNAGLAQPGTLIGLRRIPGLAEIGASGDEVRIGAMATHAAIAACGLFVGGLSLVAESARRIAHPPIRNFGTIGGSIAHADPASDWPSALVALDATVEVAGRAGRRVIRAEDFFVDFLTSALRPGELVLGVRIPSRPGAGGAYEKLARVDGDYATVSVATRLEIGRDGRCTSARIALGAAGPRPVRADSADACLAGTLIDDDAIAAAAAILAAAADPVDDVRGTAGYRRMMIPVLTRRALRRAARAAEPAHA